MLAVLPTDEARSYAGQRLREAGFSPDSFATQRIARETVADALSRLEDRHELASRSRERAAALRSVRRRLEAELWA